MQPSVYTDGSFALFESITSQSTFEPALYCAKFILHLSIAKIAQPTPKIAIDLFYYRFKTQTSVPARGSSKLRL
jgi:hypothetical protein